MYARGDMTRPTAAPIASPRGQSSPAASANVDPPSDDIDAETDGHFRSGRRVLLDNGAMTPAVLDDSNVTYPESSLSQDVCRLVER